MLANESDSPQGRTLPTALYLEYGADEHACADGAIEICERGMNFDSRWRFEIGTQIDVVCVSSEPGRARVRVEGIVVNCQPSALSDQPLFETTLLFLELPDSLKSGLRDFGAQLALS